VILRADGGTTQDLILTARNSNNGAIRFGTGTSASSPNVEAERMVITDQGLVGIGLSPVPTERLDVDGRVRVRNFSGTGTLMVTADATGVLHTAPIPTGGGSGGGNVNGTCANTNILTKWISGAVDCSAITELQTGNRNVGIGPGTTNPTKQLEVNGDINIAGTGPGKHFQITGANVLSIDGTTGGNNLFVGPTGTSSTHTGTSNTATGWNAGSGLTTGSNNTFTGMAAGSANDTGTRNTFAGMFAGLKNKSGSNNVVAGYQAGLEFVTGEFNTILGSFAGYKADTSSSNNVMVGYAAGQNNTNANGDIYIGSNGCPNAPCTENNTIRIGVGQNQTFIAGISGANIGTGAAVFVNASGQLGTVQSSRRYKEDIRDMAQASSGLMKLRPVTYRYKQAYPDGSKPVDYGLIAEEVAEIYPDMVVRGLNGQIETVQYQKLAPMLLNELQKQNRQLEMQAETIRVQEEQNRKLEARLEALEAALGRAAAAQ